jgi:hypothetical protein
LKSTPSGPVDQAWHLHLSFTKSYWKDLCKNTLEKEIHHHPTKGGKKEAEKFDTYYTSSFDLYKQKFNCEPPQDIWHNNKKRFSDIDFQRVNLQQYWLVKKPSYIFKRITLLVFVCLFAFLFIQAVGLSILFTAGATAIIILIIVRNAKRSKRNRGSGCSATGCGNTSSGGSKTGGDSGCGSGCSGDSGCSGCGGGGD